MASSGLSSNSFLNKNFIHIYPAIETIAPTIIPIKNNNPMSAPIISVATIGPGVGGTNTCAEYKPVAKHTDRKIIFFFVILDKSFTREDISMKAASQKTGIDIINPITFKLTGIFFIPRHDIKVLTIFFEVPVSFKNFPRSVPIIIIGPIANTILINPLYIKYSVSEMLIFRKTPDKKEANSKVKNGFILNLYEK